MMVRELSMLMLFLPLGGPSAAHACAPTDEIELHATWSEIEHSSHRRHETAEFSEVLQPGPASRTRSYGWDAFASLIPPAETEIGRAFHVDFAAVRPFLEQLHPRPRAESHMKRLGYAGVHAILLQRTRERIDILLRAHVEFELVPDRVFFTVAQFEGRLIVDPTKRRVLGFRLAVPPRSYNYDVHIRQDDRMLIDIGCVRELGLSGGSLPDAASDRPALRDARTKLRRAFYPFARLDWLSFADGLREAKKQNKPLHLVTIFGALDDESC